MQIGFGSYSLLRTTYFFSTKNRFVFFLHIFCSILAPEDYGEVFNSIESLSAQLFTKLHLKGSALDRIQQNHPRDSVSTWP